MEKQKKKHLFYDLNLGWRLTIGSHTHIYTYSPRVTDTYTVFKLYNIVSAMTAGTNHNIIKVSVIDGSFSVVFPRFVVP